MSTLLILNSSFYNIHLFPFYFKISPPKKKFPTPLKWFALPLLFNCPIFSLVWFQASFNKILPSHDYDMWQSEWKEAPTVLQVWWGAVRVPLSHFCDCRTVSITPFSGNNLIPPGEGFKNKIKAWCLKCFMYQVLSYWHYILRLAFFSRYPLLKLWRKPSIGLLYHGW